MTSVVADPSFVAKLVHAVVFAVGDDGLAGQVADANWSQLILLVIVRVEPDRHEHGAPFGIAFGQQTVHYTVRSVRQAMLMLRLVALSLAGRRPSL